MASTYLTRTPSSAGNRQKWTWSAWIKLSNFAGSAGSMLFSAYAHSNDEFRIYFGDTYKLSMRFYNGTEYQLTPSRLFRDLNGWYHIVVTVDTTLATSGDRWKIYINGVRETSFGDESQPTQNLQMTVNDTTPIQIGRHGTGTNYFDGYMSHVHLCDGYAYDASAFGSTDSTTGEWKINPSPSVSYGTNGFFILKDGNSVTDQSGNGNNLTVAGGTLTNTEDCPSNVFATLNSLDNYYQADTLSNGNLTMVGGGQYAPRTATLGLTTGKWYWEIQTNNFQSADGSAFGISSEVATAANYEYYNQSGDNVGYGYFSNGQVYGNASSLASGYGTGSGTHIIGVAVNLDDNKIAWSYDGTWQGSTDPGSGNTNMISITAPSSLATGTYFPAFTQKDNTRTVNVNFGNGYFGTTAISSEGTNASNLGKFEYDVPTGYTALCTKGLNE